MFFGVGMKKTNLNYLLIFISLSFFGCEEQLDKKTHINHGQVSNLFSEYDVALLAKSYHNNQNLFELVKKSRCPQNVFFSVKALNNKRGGNIHVAILKRNAARAQAQAKMFVVANQHARELIAGEIAARFIAETCAAWNACDKGTCSKEQKYTYEATKDTNFVVVFNANPVGREAVTSGAAPCTRVNPVSGIDMNRNWAEGFIPGAQVLAERTETYSGKHAFEDPNTAMIRDLFKQEKPDLFLDIHSGAFALLTNFGFIKAVDPLVFATQKKLLDSIKQEECPNCLLGSVAQELKYTGGGMALDWARVKKGLVLSFLFEIYGWDANKKQGIGEFENKCLRYYNPPPDQFNSVVNQWLQALYKVARFVAEIPEKERHS